MTPEQLDQFAEVMLRRKIRAFRAGDVEVHLAPDALMPAASEAPPAREKAPEPEPDPRVAAPWMAFRPAGEKPTGPAEPMPTFDPTDPNAPLNDRALFGADLPQR